MKPYNIDNGLKLTITGDVYSGKSSLAKKLKEKYNLKMFSVGEVLREEAVKIGMTIEEYCDYMKLSNSDYIVDKKTEKLGRENTNFIFDGRLAWYFIPDSIKIYLRTEIGIAASRALKDTSRWGDEIYISIQDATNGITSRMSKEREKFKELYCIDKNDLSNYSIVVDTSHTTEEEVFNIVCSAIDYIVSWLEENSRWAKIE